ncbi:copper resistance CopC family protein [Planotetraspora kaengkrachanensis]|uniref:Copper resistance protein C n=1 Tax=Planotetraspora kaengkrachanensis TaxID=575193 RepID=A0A8J3PPL4_9ACTN|nr:copper resistance CopC family protein [Planotetraspora kaengkrachanensis]GIG77791.1 copper resistance protein C [Planotetraspora kaengkrachanensis]
MLARWSAVLVAVLVAALWPITAAQAHDALKSSTPKKNAKVATVDKVTLEFTASVKFPKIVVRAAGGETYQQGKAEVNQGRVEQAVSGPLPSGEYTIAYRVVSSDGHPLTGEIPFTVEAPPSPGPSATPAASPSANTAVAAPSSTAPTAPQSPSGVTESASPVASTTGESLSLLWLLIGAALLAAAALFALSGRKKKTPNDSCGR